MQYFKEISCAIYNLFVTLQPISDINSESAAFLYANRLHIYIIMYEQLKLDNQLCFRLYTASRLVVNAYRPHFEALDITYPQYLVLMVLWEQDNRTITEITERLGLETNTVTPLLQRMEKAGLIVRTRGLVDTRQRIIALTKQGKALQEKCKNIPSCMATDLLSQPEGITPDELHTLAPLLDKLIHSITKPTK